MKNQSVVYGIALDKTQLSLIGNGGKRLLSAMMSYNGHMSNPGKIDSERQEGKYSFIGDDDTFDECGAFYISKVGRVNKMLVKELMWSWGSVGEVG